MSDNHSHQIASNALVLFARMLILTLVGLYTVRWVLRGLGAEDYGIYHAVAGLVTASACVSSVLSMATQRFYSYAMGQGKHEQLKEIFSASINIVLAAALAIVVLLELVGPWLIETQLTIPAHRLSSALLIFQFSTLSFVCSLLQIPFMGAMFSSEDMSLYALLSTFDCFAKWLIAYLLGSCVEMQVEGSVGIPVDRLVFFGCSMMLESLLMLILYAALSIKKYPMCRYVRIRQKGIYRQLAAFSGWTLLSTASAVGMTQGSVVLLNVFFGPLLNAAFNIANQIYNALIALGNSVVLAMRPAMTKAFGKGDTAYLDTLFYANSKALLYMMSMVVVPFLLEADSILRWWLGEVTPQMLLFARLYAVFTLCMCMHNPITTIIQASGEIRKYTIYVDCITIFCLPISWLCFRRGLPAYSIFCVMISLCLIAHVMRLYYLKLTFPRFSYLRYAKTLVLPGCIIILLSAVTAAGIHSLMRQGILRVIITGAVSTTILLSLVSLIGLTRKERQAVMEVVGKKWHGRNK